MGVEAYAYHVSMDEGLDIVVGEAAAQSFSFERGAAQVPLITRSG